MGRRLNEAAKYNEGNVMYMQELRKCRPLEKHEEIELARRIRKGDKRALHKLIDANLPFVVSVAKRYRGVGIPLQDLISEGTLGLMKAAERYDPDYHVKFITYAVWWIRCSILEGICKYAGITRLPVSQARFLSRMRKCQKALEQERGRAVSLNEVAEYSNTEIRKLELVTARTQPCASLESPSNEDDEPCLEEYLQDTASHPEQEDQTREELRGLLEGAFSCLDARQADVLSLYYGLDGSPPLTLDMIGTRYGVSRERIRQIREAALRKVRHSLQESRIDLRPYIS